MLLLTQFLLLFSSVKIRRLVNMMLASQLVLLFYQEAKMLPRRIIKLVLHFGKYQILE